MDVHELSICYRDAIAVPAGASGWSAQLGMSLRASCALESRRSRCKTKQFEVDTSGCMCRFPAMLCLQAQARAVSRFFNRVRSTVSHFCIMHSAKTQHFDVWACLERKEIYA